MSKITKIFLAAAGIITLAVAANIICGLFSTRMKKYYRVDSGRF